VSTSGISAGTENVTANVSVELALKVLDLANESGLSRSKYVRALLEDAVNRRRVFRLRRESFIEESPADPGRHVLKQASKTKSTAGK